MVTNVKDKTPKEHKSNVVFSSLARNATKAT